MRWTLPVIFALCCGCTSQDSQIKNDSDTCAAGTKRCGTACVRTDLPDLGCAAASCDACPVITQGSAICVQGSCATTCAEGWADCDHKSENGCEIDLRSSLLDCGACSKPCKADHSEAACEAGSCVVKNCEAVWKDCNGMPSDGCEANTHDNPSHCGACGQACATGEVCYEGQCAKNPEVLAWLATQKGGWCLDDYKKLVNLCGKVSVCHYTLCGDLDTDPAGSPSCYDDYQHEHEMAVPFCCDTRFLKAYPKGIAIDVGFHYDGVSTGSVLDIGGDVESGRVTLTIETGGRLSGGVLGGELVETTIVKGSYLVSFHASTSRAALFVNGLLVDEAAGTPTNVVLVTESGPGMVLGSRMSYWWEHPGTTLRFAPFLFHLRDGVPAGDWSLKEATQAATGTLLLFNDQGTSGNAWTAVVGEQTAYAVPQNSADPAPVWQPDAASQCF